MTFKKERKVKNYENQHQGSTRLFWIPWTSDGLA
jgi:hypothetical protein